MLRYVVVLALVLGCAFGSENAENEAPAAAEAVKAAQFQTSSLNYDHQVKKADQDCSSPEENKIHYLLFTREKPNGEVIIRDAFNISDSALNVKKHMKIIINSMLSENNDWVKNIVNDYLYSQNVDVLVVDWSEYGNNCNAESTSVYVTPFVGLALSHMLRTIIGLGQSGHRMHLIGFSHGAHIAGIAGRFMAPHLPARITALDPVRLDELDQPGGGKLSGGDAKFIDAIYTSLPALSFEYEMGDVTFYPNGGFTKYQARCDDVNDPMGKIICSHKLAFQLFAESLVSPHSFPALTCESYTKFLSGKCTVLDGSSLSHMGEYVESSARGRYFLAVNKDAPYDKGYDLPGPQA